MFGTPEGNRTLFSAVKTQYSKPVNYGSMVSSLRLSLVYRKLRADGLPLTQARTRTVGFRLELVPLVGFEPTTPSF